jgi:hypothetical protein
MDLSVISGFLDDFVAAATIIMFFSWLYERRQYLKKIFTLETTSQVLPVLGAGFLLAGNYQIALPCYFVSWTLHCLAFFKDEDDSIKRVKQKTFNLVMATGIVIFALLSSMIMDVIELIRVSGELSGALMESQERLMENQNSILDYLDSEQE